ncbi:MAG: hypothetical protein IT317_11525 [Anaerolineales bacterium]|nr:hypothetical protein [Anaerolineales bacterium]
MTAEKNDNATLHQVPSEPGPAARPIVFEYKKPKKKKAKATAAGAAQYTRGLEDVQVVSGDWLRATRKAVGALAKGLETYERERLRSAAEKTDGALEDFPYNAGKAASVWLKEASDIPLDIAEAAKQRSYAKRARKNLRRVSKLLRVGGR